MEDNTITGIIVWIVGVLVSLSVGSGMIDKTLTIPLVPEVITVIAGWIVVLGTILSVILTIFNK